MAGVALDSMEAVITTMPTATATTTAATTITHAVDPHHGITDRAMPKAIAEVPPRGEAVQAARTVTVVALLHGVEDPALGTDRVVALDPSVADD